MDSIEKLLSLRDGLDQLGRDSEVLRCCRKIALRSAAAFLGAVFQSDRRTRPSSDPSQHSSGVRGIAPAPPSLGDAPQLPSASSHRSSYYPSQQTAYACASSQALQGRQLRLPVQPPHIKRNPAQAQHIRPRPISCGGPHRVRMCHTRRSLDSVRCLANSSGCMYMPFSKKPLLAFTRPQSSPLRSPTRFLSTAPLLVPLPSSAANLYMMTQCAKSSNVSEFCQTDGCSCAVPPPVF